MVKKTWAREFAVFGIWIPFLAYIWFDGRLEIIEAMVWPISTLVGGSFGLKVTRMVKGEKPTLPPEETLIQKFENKGASQ